MSKSEIYWANRANKRFAESEKYSEAQINRIWGIYNEAQKDLQKMIDEIYGSYAGQSGLDRQMMERIINSADLKQLINQVKKESGKDITEQVMRNYKGRINRLQALQLRLQAKAEQLTTKVENTATATLKSVTEQSYRRTMYDIGKAENFNSASFATLDDRTIDQMLKTKWVANGNYSQRIWKNESQLVNKLDSLLTRGVMTGMSYERMSMELRQQFRTEKYKADRLIRTEMAYFHNEAEKECYEDLGIDQYIYIATLDDRTSEVCRDLDGKIFKTKEGQAGKNMPPMHPNCRSTTGPYYDDDNISERKRRARKEDGENDVIKYQTYREWEKSLTNNPKESNNERAIASQRNMAMGLRQSPLINLDDEQISRIKQEAAEIGIPINVLSFNTGYKTGYVDDLNIIRIRNDINPDEAGRTARDLMSSRAVLAHEYYGHYLHAPSKYEPGDWRDEFEASYYAAINTPNLTDEERAMLMTDAYDRAEEAGEMLEKTQEALKILYG